MTPSFLKHAEYFINPFFTDNGIIPHKENANGGESL